ncbi:Eco57I restriction-modification methylase domain-containing protein [Pseudomonas aeruginosa]|uniref:Eco57I restriction-modification methylase domain-containing protein n=1 Tax=Pseudomonas aeruginosa TaxID=287 RepID=UPI000AD490FC|nr:type IIL restriction-modification enzyme MmeI [Pseudomonas aeruginosa]HCF7326981.1 hypothetical protein [Pseudomonas aeruginosa]
MKPRDIHDEWLSLIEVSGPFLATPVLERVFSTGLPAVEPRIRQYLRQAHDEWCEAGDNEDPRFAELHRAWIHEVLARGLEYDEDDSGELLRRGERLPDSVRVTLPEHGVMLAPDYALVSNDKPLLLVQGYPAGTDLTATMKIDGWIASPAERMERLCRASGCRLGLITDGERWMLVDAPVGAVVTYASWYARLWSQERQTLQAFIALLGIARFFGAEDETLPALLDESLQHQEAVTDALGEQVRRAVEVLIQALDKEDRDRSRTLLQGVEPAELYEAGLTIMMRLVFLLSAEERGLLLMGDETYESDYAISTLRMQLRQETEEVLEHRHDAWARLLATFRAVYGGIEHEALRLPALGGSLFDPDRFPFLEGRAKGSDWEVDVARPLPIDNRTVLLLLEAIQQYQGRTLSYRALDVEQIGYVYEGLLERTVARTTRVTVELSAGKGAKKTLYGLDDLEALHRRSVDALADELSGADAIKRSASAIRRDLERAVDAEEANRLLTACGGDEHLRERVLPFFHLLRTDPWGYPLVYPEGAFIVTTGSDRRETGTHYTPKSLTETIVTETLTPIVYVGPAEGLPRAEWTLKSPAELLDLKICDPAMGSGAFLVQTCRWLAERLVEAWTLAEDRGETIDADGQVADAGACQEPLASDIEARTTIARRLIAERCLYGVDLNPLAVELAKLSIWLVTLAKGRPFGFLDHNLRCGDSLLGIHRLDQLTELSMTPERKGERSGHLFGQDIQKAVLEAIELRQRLREMPIRDIHDVETMARLDADARHLLDAPERIADAFIGQVYTANGNKTLLKAALSSLAIQAGQAINGQADALIAINDQASTTLAIELPSGKTVRRPFHWPLEFPEVFQRNGCGFDALVGNPPFVTGKRISTYLGEALQAFIKNTVEDSKGAADLCVYFMRRGFSLTRLGGLVGMVATKSIAEGDSRTVGTAWLRTKSAKFIWAVHELPWPGQASVTVSLLVMIRGDWKGAYTLNGKRAIGINSRLADHDGEDVPEPKALLSNRGKCTRGIVVLGSGFLISEEERQEYLSNDPRNNEVIKPYLTGMDIVQGVGSKPTGWIISFGLMPYDKASKFSKPFQRIEELVKPYRDGLTGQIHEADFWKFWDKREDFFASMQGKSRILACSRTAKYLAMVFIDEGWIPSDGVGLFSFSDFSSFAIMQSSIHETWARQQSGKLEQRLTYNFSKTFSTFPWPKTHSIDEVGESFYSVRSKYCENHACCITDMYNAFHDEGRADADLAEARAHFVNLDREVLRAYGWDDIDLDHGFRDVTYLAKTDCRRFTISEIARLEILRRVSDLNLHRHNEESEQSQKKKPKSSKPTRGGRSTKGASKEILSDLFDEENA